MTTRADDLLLSPVFVGALAAWAFNDHVLQRVAPGVLSGKLGDAASMVAFPILLAATVAPLARRVGLSERRLVDVCALGTAALLVAIQLSDAAAEAYRVTFGGLQYAVGWSPVYGPVAHTMDATDALVAPFALLPCILMRRGRARPTCGVVLLVLLVLASALLGGCGPSVGRGAWRGEVTARTYGGVTDSSQFEYGAAPSPVSVDVVGTHRAPVLGASAEASFRVRRRGVVGGNLSVATGWVKSVDEDYQRFGAYTERFGVVSMGPTFGFYGRRVLLRGGALLLVGAGRGQRVDPRRVLALPYARLEWGDPSRLRWVLQLGSSDGYLWDARVVAVGLSVRHPRGYLAFGYAVGARVGPDLHGVQAEAFVLASRHVAPVESYAWLELLVRVDEGTGVVVSAQGGRQLPVVAVGLRWELDRVARLPPDGSLHHWLPLPPVR